MRTRNLSLLLTIPLLMVGLLSAQAAFGIGTILLRAAPSTLLADGRSVTTIIAEVRDTNGAPVTGGVDVQFQTDLGTLAQSSVRVIAGRAQVRMTSSRTPGIATIRAFASNGGAATLEVLFTDDPNELFEGNAYVQVSGSSYLAYSATDQVVEANGKNGGAKVTYRNLQITADRIQLQCSDNVVRAQNNITLRRGKNVVKVSKLYYSLQSDQGYAIGELDGRTQPVEIIGQNLRVDPSRSPIPTSYVSLPELQSNLVIAARGITYFPNDKLQFRAPKFYQDRQLILSLPHYEMPLRTQELFSDQFLSVGSNGLQLELPYYFSMSPSQTGTLYLRHQQQIGNNYFGNRPGWSLDLMQNYNTQGAARSEGMFGFTGLTRSDWGFRWMHNQEFNSATQGMFYLDFPQHRSVIGTTSFNQQMRHSRWGFNLLGGRTFSGPETTTWNGNVTWETNPHPLARSRDYTYTIGTNFNTGSTISGDALIGTFNQTSQEVNFNAFSRPLNLGKRTQLSNRFSVGQVWGTSGATGTSAQAELFLNHDLRGGANLSVIYAFLAQPSGIFQNSGNHRLSLTYDILRGNRFEARLLGSSFLDSSDASLIGSLAYRMDSYWRLMGTVAMQRFGDLSYQDIQITLGRRIGARELQLTYSTFTKRISLDLTATRF